MMDRRDLYKGGVEKLRLTQTKLKRSEQINANRTLKRKELFQTVRPLECSPAKENEKPAVAKNGKKLSKREEYILKFKAWKAEKDKQRQKEKEWKEKKPRPFCPVVRPTSFAPGDHKFQPPAGLKYTLGKENVSKHLSAVKNNENLSKPITTVKNKVLIKSVKQNVTNRLPVVHKVEKKVPIKLKTENKLHLKKPLVTSSTTTSNKQIKTHKERNLKNSRILQLGLEDKQIPSKGDAAQNLRKNLSTVSLNKPADTCRESYEEDKEAQQVEPPASCPLFKNVDLNVTPICENDNRPPNYVSPFVTTSRGKVSNRKEKENRESIYRLEVSSPGEPIHVRRVRESVKYFRTVLNEEISRLLSMCKIWEEYQAENLAILEECGSSMIDATIGQTKLLTSKKLEQFRELIDRCEAHAVGGNLNYQAVLPEDLEGFWSMVRLQIDNVDKRFENLNQWKANEWCDPAEVKQKTKNLTSKVTKPRVKKKQIKSNDVLKELLKKAQAAYKQSKRENACIDSDIILVTTKRRSSNARRSISNTPVRRSKRLETPKKLDFPKQVNVTRKGTPYTRKSTPMQNSPKTSTPRRTTILRRSLLTANSQSKTKKSILKTPGTAKKYKQAVVFNEQLDYKSPEVYSAENSMSGLNMLEQTPNDMLRALHLRSRRVILRPDHEIQIPVGK